MAELHLSFVGQSRTSCSAYAFVLTAGGTRVGRGWGALGTGMTRLGAALLGIERGLEFVTSSLLADQSLVAEGDGEVINAIMDPERGDSVPRKLRDCISQFDSLRFKRVDIRENAQASGLARFSIARYERTQRPFEVCDDAGLTTYTAHNKNNPGDEEPRNPHHTDPFFALPLAPEQFQHLLDLLPMRDREMIRLRYPQNGNGYTLEDIGRIFKISRARVSQIVNRAIDRLWKIAARMNPRL